MGGTCTGTPDWNAWLASVWGWGCEGPGWIYPFAAASNVVVGTNPPFTIQDFLAIYAQFGGPPISPAPTATVVSGSPQITVNSNAGMAVGNPVAGAGIADGSLITAISGSTITLSANATANGTGVSLTVWNAPPVPFAAVLAYIYIASASLVQERWQELWTFAMALYVAHFATLLAKELTAAAIPNTGQLAAQGLAFGIQVSKSVHDVSVSYQPVGGLESWGSWNLTTFGQQLATYAKVIGSGPMLLY